MLLKIEQNLNAGEGHNTTSAAVKTLAIFKNNIFSFFQNNTSQIIQPWWPSGLERGSISSRH